MPESEKLDPNSFLYEFGRFVVVFAGAENHIFIFLCELTGLSHAECTAILNKQKVDQCISTVRRLFEVRAKKLPDDLEAALEQLSAIATFRNEMLHGGVAPDGTVTDFAKALPRKVKEYKVSVSLLTQAIDDLAKIGAILSFHLPDYKLMPDPPRSFLEKARQRPWQYKSPAQDNKRQPNPKNGQKHQHQRKPSGKKD